MSQQKITSKNLSYDTSLPPFLARLKAQAGSSSGPDPLLAGNRRSAKKRSGSEEAEDIPLVVDEDGNVVSVEVDKDGEITRQPVDEAAQKDGEAVKEGEKQETEAKATIGGRKRKVGRVVGDAAEEQDAKATKATKDDDKDAEPPKDRKPKKKAKKIKLSFDEDAG
jgi:hypothetical protein